VISLTKFDVVLSAKMALWHSITTFSIMTLSITTFSIMAFSIMTLSITTFSIIENKMQHSA